MTPKKRRSSRARCEARWAAGKTHRTATFFVDGKDTVAANRKAKRETVSADRHAYGKMVRQAAADARKAKQKKVRKEIRKMRKATKAAMAARAGA